MSIENTLVRLYETTDRQAVWDIACDTADRGKPVENFFPDREIVAQILMRYYTDYEPQALWVAECDKKVVGYLSGCLDSSRYTSVMAWRIMPGCVTRAVLRGLLWRKETLRIFRAGIKSILRGGVRSDMPMADYPAHMHINLRDGFRGQHLGRRLIDNFMHQAISAGVKGIHASVLEDNLQACKFFSQSGFSVLRRYPVYLPNDNACCLHHTLIYGRKLKL
jgi:ribosomal protein S18 acetylase RimI-like enzyme